MQSFENSKNWIYYNSIEIAYQNYHKLGGTLIVRQINKAGSISPERT